MLSSIVTRVEPLCHSVFHGVHMDNHLSPPFGPQGGSAAKHIPGELCQFSKLPLRGRSYMTSISGEDVEAQGGKVTH